MSQLLHVCYNCGAQLKTRRTYLQHIKTSKKCKSVSSFETIKCMWCSSIYNNKNSLETHYKTCQANKEVIYTKLLEQMEKMEKDYKEQIEKREQEYKEHIKELEDKLFKLANKSKTTINSTTINNVNLICDKPLILSEERIMNILQTKCTREHIFNGELGVGQLIIEHICRNDAGKLCLECTDIKRKNLRYIDENGIQQTISMDKFMNVINKCLLEFRKTPKSKSLTNGVTDKQDIFMEGMRDFFKLDKPDCCKYIVDRTYKDSPLELLTSN
jgi:hypothetical protein